ncbi:hypothetical protein [Methyloraptor flagellatus]|uniref:Uncharacterized protein n=1 Tax=Methyloraptor flagellatus TaxID=3162530 RepID=A0AAU7XE26_9HYPH
MGVVIGIVLSTFLIRSQMPMAGGVMLWQIGGSIVGAAAVTSLFGVVRARREPAEATLPPLSRGRRLAVTILLTIAATLILAIVGLIALRHR